MVDKRNRKGSILEIGVKMIPISSVICQESDHETFTCYKEHINVDI